MSEFKKHEPCSQCGSSDALARYKDGHGYCFSCQHYEPPIQPFNAAVASSGKENTTKLQKRPPVWAKGECKALPKRGITLETCQKWDYQLGYVNGKFAHIANYRDATGKLRGQKIRFIDKTFLYYGHTPTPLYGMHLWDKGKMVVVVEGEIDALSVSQIQQNKWPVVSVPNGAQSAYKSLQQHLSWFDGFESVVLMFDQDEPGQEATQTCIELFKPGRVRIASLPLKDPNEMLMAGRVQELKDAIWNARTYYPDGIIAGSTTWELITSTSEKNLNVPYPYECLNRKTKGLRPGEIVTFCAGTGIGKSQVCREIAYHLIKRGYRVGYIALEESLLTSIRALMGLELSLPLHRSFSDVSQVCLKQAWENIAPHTTFYDHFGSLDPQHLFNRIRYMVVGMECPFIILDHISIVISGIGEGDERRLIDNVMTQLRSLVEELQIALILVTHLKRPEGKGHEEGAATSLSQLRGSAAIGQLSDIVIGLERDQQGKTPHILNLRILKNRFTGKTGVAGSLEYSPATGRLFEVYTCKHDNGEKPS